MTRIRTESKRGLVVACVVLALSGAVMTAASHARAEPADERALARGHFDRGVALAKAGSYEAALLEFQQAYRIAPHFSVLYNIGQAELALDRPGAAVETFRRYLAEGQDQIEPARRAEVVSTIASELERMGPREEPNEAPEAEPGEVAAERAAPSPPPAHDAAPAPSPPARRDTLPSPPLAPAEQAQGNGQRTLAYVLGGAGIVLASAALAHYAWNRGRFEEWQTAHEAYYADPRPPRRDAANELADSIDRASRVTVALAIGAGVTLGTGTVLFFGSRSTASSSRAGNDETWIGVRGAF
jgi:tetratricopeptide (TPR) repeat protein